VSGQIPGSPRNDYLHSNKIKATVIVMSAKRGQPPKGERALRVGIKVRLTEADRARLDRLAGRSGMGPATKARMYVLEGMAREEEAASEAPSQPSPSAPSGRDPERGQAGGAVQTP